VATIADEGYRELARRLLGAFMSYRMGIKSVDYTLREYVGDGDGNAMHESWVRFAEALDREMEHAIARKAYDDISSVGCAPLRS
jgi:hypothetical protein